MTESQSIRSRTAMRRENENLRADINAAAQVALKGDASATAISKAQWPQWAVAVFSAMISLAIAGIGGWFAVNGVHFGADEDRQRESREKRAQVYADYLAAARNARIADDDSRRTYQEWARADAALSTPTYTAAQNSAVVRAATRHGQASKKASDALVELFKRADLVYVYGSDDAWTAHQAVLSSLGAPSTATETSEAASERLSAEFVALQQFQSVFCREASATPRKGCTSDVTDQFTR